MKSVVSRIRTTARHNTEQITKGTHPVPGYELKFLTSPGIEPEPPSWKAGRLPTTPKRRTPNKVRYPKL